MNPSYPSRHDRAQRLVAPADPLQAGMDAAGASVAAPTPDLPDRAIASYRLAGHHAAAAHAAMSGGGHH
jgi:hypothetical protein